MICPFPAPFFKKKFPEPLKTLSFKHFRESVQCRRPESNRYGYHYPRDFKSRASASSATAAAIKLNFSHHNMIRETTQKRLELSTSAVTGRRSNQLSHWALLFALTCNALHADIFREYLRTNLEAGKMDLRGLEPRTDRL